MNVSLPHSEGYALYKALECVNAIPTFTVYPKLIATILVGFNQ